MQQNLLSVDSWKKYVAAKDPQISKQNQLIDTHPLLEY